MQMEDQLKIKKKKCDINSYAYFIKYVLLKDSYVGSKSEYSKHSHKKIGIIVYDVLSDLC
jgi:hypothetical protein